MKDEFDQAANDSPRSGSSKTVTPVAWFFVILAVIAFGVWFAVKP